MNVSLTKELERMVASKVASGMYSSASEVIREALRLLAQKERGDIESLERIRKEVAAGLAEIESGQTIAYDKTSLRKRIASVKTNGRKLRGKGNR
jgi:antitoxin ParD1/3/4